MGTCHENFWANATTPLGGGQIKTKMQIAPSPWLKRKGVSNSRQSNRSMEHTMRRRLTVQTHTGLFEVGVVLAFGLGCANAVAGTPPLILDDPAPQAFANFGSAVAGLGDLDGDGKDDVLVGGDGEDDLDGNQGRDILIGGTDADKLKGHLAEAGFTERHWADTSAKALDWFDGLAGEPGTEVEAPRGPSIAIVLGPEAAKKSRNVQRNLREGRIQLIQALFASP